MHRASCGATGVCPSRNRRMRPSQYQAGFGASAVSEGRSTRWLVCTRARVEAERAILEALDESPNHASFHDLDMYIRRLGLATAQAANGNAVHVPKREGAQAVPCLRTVTSMLGASAWRRHKSTLAPVLGLSSCRRWIGYWTFATTREWIRWTQQWEPQAATCTLRLQPDLSSADRPPTFNDFR